MEVIYVDEEDIKHVTEFLLDRKLIFHPDISPNGVMDFTQYGSRDYILLLDRNILTKMIEFYRKGILKDEYIRKVIACIMFWAHANHVVLNSGLALNEYANCSNDNSRASIENNIFKDAMNFYHPNEWLSIAMGRSKSIEPLPNISDETYCFRVDNDHQLMHVSEMFCIARIYFDDELTQVEKMFKFLKWNFQNLLICQYTIIYAMLVFSGKSKVFRKVKSDDIDEIVRICRNQAWDLTYLSDWSTLYWNDCSDDTVYLFATMDKEMKQIFMEAHEVESDVFTRFFNTEDASKIDACFTKLQKDRVKPILNSEIVKEFYNSEYELLVTSMKNFG